MSRQAANRGLNIEFSAALFFFFDNGLCKTVQQEFRISKKNEDLKYVYYMEDLKLKIQIKFSSTHYGHLSSQTKQTRSTEYGQYEIVGPMRPYRRHGAQRVEACTGWRRRAHVSADFRDGWASITTTTTSGGLDGTGAIPCAPLPAWKWVIVYLVTDRCRCSYQ